MWWLVAAILALTFIAVAAGFVDWLIWGRHE